MNPASDDAPKLLSDSEQIEAVVREFLKRRVHLFHITISSRGIELHGYCDSFHTKQMAQEIVSQHTRLRIAANHLVVHYARRIDVLSDSSQDRDSEE